MEHGNGDVFCGFQTDDSASRALGTARLADRIAAAGRCPRLGHGWPWKVASLLFAVSLERASVAKKMYQSRYCS